MFEMILLHRKAHLVSGRVCEKLIKTNPLPSQVNKSGLFKCSNCETKLNQNILNKLV